MYRQFYFLLFLLLTLPAAAQYAEVKGTVTDGDEEPVIGVTITLRQGGSLVKGTVTDSEGKYQITGISPGIYTLEATAVGFAKMVYTMNLSSDVNYKNITMQIHEGPIIVVKPKESPVKEMEIIVSIPQSVASVMPVRSVAEKLNTIGGVNSIDGYNISFNGARPSGTAFYLGSMPLLTRIDFSPRAISQVGAILGGVAPEYGDFVGGAVVQYITAPELKTFKASAEYITSSLFDKYHYNQADLTLSGPLIRRYNASVKDSTMILGFHTNLNFLYQADPSPSGTGVWKVKDDKLKEIENAPLVAAPGGQGYVPRAEFLTQNDLELVQARQNAAAKQLTWVGRLDYRPNLNTMFEYGMVVRHNHSQVVPYNSTLLNYSNNPVNKNTYLTSYLNFSQSFQSKDTSRKRIKSASYLVSLQYQSYWNETTDEVHGDNYFDYGHVGRFQNYRAPVYNYIGGEGPSGQAKPYVVDGDTVWLKNIYELSAYQDTLYTFDRTTSRNPLLANYTQQYYDFTGKVENLGDIRSSGAGLANGSNPLGIYSNMWSNVGTQQIGSSINSGVNKSQSEQFGVNVQGNLSIGAHNIKMGLYYEQRFSRSYSVNAMALWPLMYQSANEGLELDRENPILVYDEKGLFQDTVRYEEKFNDKQGNFSKNLRTHLMEQGHRDVNGELIDENSYIDVNTLDPSQLSLSMFSATELLGTGGNNQFVKYYGYDYLGNKTRGSSSVSEFLGDPQNRRIGAFNPIYTAAFIQDRFEFKSMLIRVGMRVERFDANQPVLKDAFSLYPVRTAGETRELNGQAVSHPDAVQSHYKVYVNDVSNPTQITGYRNGNEWYNAEGIKIADPAVIAQLGKSGNIQPYLVDAEKQDLTEASFEAYDPKTIFLPRIAFDFPISSEARFFAYYDVLAQRPSNIFTPVDDYYFLKYNPTQVINNPNLKPQITTDYEIGFKQALSDKSALSLIATYREQRNLIQLVRYNYAYPYSYTSYGNIDFATVKGLRVEYFQEIQHLLLNGSYSFQIADGTGSGPASQTALVSAGQPNLRSLFPLDNDIRHNLKLNMIYDFGADTFYSGPRIAGRKILQNGGISLVLNTFSGIPYTANALPTASTQAGVVQRSPILGTPNGSRTPWQFQNNLSIYRSFDVVLGKRAEGPMMGKLTVTLWVQNFLNIRNTLNVHPFTGSGSDDGYLNSPQGKKAVEDAINAQSFVDLYNAALNNPAYYGLPRRTRLSLLLTF